MGWGGLAVANLCRCPQIVDFLNRFESSARFKLSCVNEKLYSVERALEFCEASVKASGRGIDKAMS